MIENGKPNEAVGGTAMGCLLIPVFFLGGGWAIGQLTDLLKAVFGG